MIRRNGEYYTTNFDLSNHYESDILVIEKFQQTKIWTAAYYEAEHKAPYLKRFYLEAGNRRNLLGDNPKNSIYLLTDECYPRIEIIFGGIDSFREPLIVEAEEFVVARALKPEENDSRHIR